MTALDTPAVEPRVRRRRRRLIVTALLVLLVAGVCVGGWFYRQYTSPEYVRSLVVSRLEKMFNLPVDIAKADFAFFRGTILSDVQIHTRGAKSAPGSAATGEPPLLEIKQLKVEHDPLSLIFGRFRIRRAAVDSPVLNIVAGPDHALRDFTLPKSKRKDREVELPALDISNAQINLLRENGPPVSLSLSLRGRQGQGIYDVVWQQAGDESETGRLQIDLKRGVLRAADGGTPWFSADTLAAGADFAGPQVGEWIARLGVRGEVRAREFTIPFKRKGVVSAEQVAHRAILECRDGFVSIPVAEAEDSLAPQERYLRFTDVDAEVELAAGGIQSRATASLHGSPVEIEVAATTGLDNLSAAATAGFQANITARDFRFPRRGEGAPADEARFVELAPRFTKFYDEYHPAGLMDVELTLSRLPGEGRRITLDHALFHATDAAVSTKYFPYPMGDVTGFVEFTPSGVYIRDMCGSRAGGSACLNGWLGGTKRCSATTLEITAENILIDEELFIGLGPKRAWIREQFGPVGRVDAAVLTYRPECDPEAPAKWISEVNVFPQAVSATYSQLPYPLKEISGRIKVLDDEFSVELEGQAGAAPVAIGGGGDVVDRKVNNIDLRVIADDLALDQQLMEALPPETGREVAAFRGHGSIDVDAHIFPGETPDKVRHRTSIWLNKIAIQHDRVPLPLQDVTGEVTIEPERIYLRRVSGRYGDARIAATGDLPKGGPASGSRVEPLIVGIENLTLDANVRAAVPPGLQRAMDTWHVGGPIDARISVTRSAASGQLAFGGDVLFNQNTVQPDFLPDQFRDVHGVIRFDSDQVVAKEIEGVYGNAPVIANFIIQTKAGASRGDVKLLAYGLSAEKELLSLLPQNVRDTFRRLGAGGKVDLQIDRLTYVQKSPEEERVWTAQAGVRFNDAALPGLGGLRRILGTAGISGSVVDARGGTSLSGELRLQHASLFDRDLTEVVTPWSFVRSAEGNGFFTLERITANVYGGQLSGRTEVQFGGDRSEYSITSVIQDMSLTSFINAGRRTPTELEARGTVNANLYLTGEAGRLDSLRGGGQFEIVEGWLYRLPIILAILNVLELTFEPSEAFDEAAAEFYIVGDRVTFRDIVVKGGVLALVGEGVLAIPDLAVDFRLVNVPGQWWARLPLIDDLMKGAVREFVEIRVSGPITQPSVKTQPVPRVTDEIKRLFERRRPKRVVSPGS